MKRPLIICRMVTSIDGEVTGDLLPVPACVGASDIWRGTSAGIFSRSYPLYKNCKQPCMTLDNIYLLW